MKFIQVPPPESLRRYIRYSWVMESAPADAVPDTFRPLADGSPGLILQNGDAPLWQDGDGKQLPRLFLYGQTVQTRILHTKGSTGAIGIGFHPHALKALFGWDAGILTDTCTDLHNAVNKPLFTLAENLHEKSAQERLQQLYAYLQSRMYASVKEDAQVERAMNRILQSGGTLPIQELLNELALSERSLERRFRSHIGISPKLFSRICRFQSSLQQLRSRSFDKLSDLAFENGYADQSHFIRNFREFTGISPEEYRRREPLSDMVL